LPQPRRQDFGLYLDFEATLDVSALKIDKYLSLDNASLEKCVLGARKRVENKFVWDEIVKDLINLYYKK
jgi:glycosyltransferase involved in cell wall biosynthesis